MNLPLPRWYREKVEPVPDTEDQKVSTLELFFDLVFVFTVTQLTHVVAHDFTSGVIQTLLMFAVIWYMYSAYAWMTNAVPPQRPARRVLLLVAMAGWFVIALAVPDAFHGTGVWLGAGMVVVVVLHGLMYLQSTNRILVFLSVNLTGAILIVIAGFQHGLPQYLLWTAALVVMWLGPALTGQEGFPLHPGHITERHGLVVIVALGESIIVVGSGALKVGEKTGELNGQIISVAILGLALTACLWWAYFTADAVRAEHALVSTGDQVRRTRMVLLGFFFSHIPILLGIVGMAAGLGDAIGKATKPLAGGPGIALGAGVALFLLGSVLFRISLRLPAGTVRIVAVVLSLATIPLGRVAAVWQLVALFGILLAVVITEEASRRRDQLVTSE
ncbi:low temperature requirement protein A [Stackebrandtia nassauensis]|uniref:Low temperature requirement A n=1 Tax=Stackebrandtia nassauensis (strain DSM 44728 / CIP 108903 / NRRL B-16338 / NBRC 102104 / LLR-40K-21) TaxID=446470 RepID=D3Q2I7_STANL|nr:low temperature requirement protein A [Stackebrandtia nassauensis]ADD43920.1 low temperature requirement A [Stackebrandtia nassauensis DSM 44728]